MTRARIGTHSLRPHRGYVIRTGRVARSTRIRVGTSANNTDPLPPYGLTEFIVNYSSQVTDPDEDPEWPSRHLDAFRDAGMRWPPPLCPDKVLTQRTTHLTARKKELAYFHQNRPADQKPEFADLLYTIHWKNEAHLGSLVCC